MNEATITYLSLLIGVTGLILTVVYYRKSRKRKMLACTTQNFQIMNKSWGRIEKLQFNYDKINIDDLTISDIYVWNKGNVTIEKDDIANLSPLEIASKPPHKILDSFITETNENSNNWTILKLEDKILIKMDYVDPGQGCKITVYHTGKALSLEGKIKGGVLKKEKLIVIRKDRRRRDKFYPVIIIIISIPILIYKIFTNNVNDVIFLLTFVPLSYLLMRLIPSPSSHLPEIFNEFRYGNNNDFEK